MRKATATSISKIFLRYPLITRAAFRRGRVLNASRLFLLLLLLFCLFLVGVANRQS